MRRLALTLVTLSLGCGETAPTDEEPPPDLATAGPPDLAAACQPPAADGGAPLDPDCPIVKPAQPDRLDEALAQAGLDRCRFAFPRGLFRPDPLRLPWFIDVHRHGVRWPPFAATLVAHLDQAATSETPVTRGLIVAGEGLGLALAPCLSPPLVDGAAPLAEAVARLSTELGGKVDPGALAQDAADVPRELQLAVAEVVLAVAAANREVEAQLAPLSAGDRDELLSVVGLALPSAARPTITDPEVQKLLATGFDQRTLLGGAARLAWAIERARLSRFAGRKGFQFDQSTPIGRIVIADGANQTWPDEPQRPILLLIDTGGDDQYLFPAGAVDGTVGANGRRRVGVAIDLAGKDRYGYPERPSRLDGKRLPSDDDGRYTPRGDPKNDHGPISLSEVPRQGAARLGYGLLFDLGTDGDKYRSLRLSQGFGAAGVGVLYDQGGDDLYEGEAGVQGAGIFGVGLLLDGGGNDVYRTYSQSQGYGYVHAVGVLYDQSGNDQFLADVGDPMAGGDPLYLSAQLPGRANSSFVQGAGFGRRADLSDGASLSGGLGLLRDRAGHDVYTAGVFAQGTGYWFGAGILADGAGNDRYDGKWYVQGAAAHFALALHRDDGGDDRYNQSVVPSATSIGVGHDLSHAWHLDLGGNDLYRAPGLALGSGHANGIGVFVNLGGDDRYAAPGSNNFGAATIGDAGGQRHRYPTFGLFLDVGGTDQYPAVAPMPGNDKIWPNNIQGMGYENHGAGLDRGSGGVGLP